MRNNLLRILLLLVFQFTFIEIINAATLNVTNTLNGGPGSLRYVVAHAPSGSTITFDTSLAGKDINITSGQIYINKNLTFLGLPPTSKVYFVTNYVSRVFYVDAGASVTFKNCYFYNCGYTGEGIGGAIFNAGNVGIIECEFVNNIITGQNIVEGAAIYNKGTMQIVKTRLFNNQLYTANGIAKGGAISNSGNLSILQSSCRNNVAQSDGEIARGGSIYNVGIFYANKLSSGYEATVSRLTAEGGSIYNKGTAEIQNSEVDGGSTDGDNSRGGGYFSTQGSLKVVNSTLFSNICYGSNAYGGGAFATSGILELINCTITDNNVSGSIHRASGVGVSNGLLRIGSTIVAKNTNNNELGGTDVYAPKPINVQDLGYNLIGVIDSSNLSAPTNIYGTLSNPLDPMLGTFGTICELLPGSPAIDAGDPNSTLKNDQLEFVRPINNRIDIGAAEFGSFPLPVITITEPPYGSIYQTPVNININTTLSGTSGFTITKVEFYNGNILFATDNSAPYSAVFPNAPAGVYSITAKAYLTTGAIITSLPAYETVQTLPIPNMKLASITNVLSDVNLYPNPVIDVLTIENAPTDIKITVYDESGNLVYVMSGINSANISSLPPGTYIISLQSEERNLSKVVKIVKQ